MPRQPRIEGAGLIHHVTGHSLPEADAFPDHTATRGFLSLLAQTIGELRWALYAYCLLSSHYHLLLETELPNLGEGMRRLHGRHAARLNHRLGRTGRLWRDRFHSRVVTSGLHVVRAAAYIDVNPVTAGLCSHPANWRWSSYRANAGLAYPPPWHRVDRLYGYLDAPASEAPLVYREIVATNVEIVRERARAGRRSPTTGVSPLRGQTPT